MIKSIVRTPNTVLSVIAIEPLRVGGAEIWLRELADQLAGFGWKSVICFLTRAPDHVRDFFVAPYITLDVLKNSEKLSWETASQFRNLLRRYRPRIIHMQHTGIITLYPLIAKAHFIKKVFYTDQASKPEGFIPYRAKAWKRLAARMIDAPLTRVFCVSGYVEHCHRVLGLLPAEKFEVLYNAIDMNRAATSSAVEAFKQRFQIPRNRKIVTQVSWMIPQKGITDLLRAAKLILPQQPDTQFVMVGEGAGRPEFERLARELQIADNITFTGLVDDPLTNGVFAGSDVVCQVSRWEEAFGQTIAEAMSCSKPVIGTRVGGIPELIEDGKTGFLVDRGDSSEMANRILQLLADTRLRNKMGAAGRELAVKKFNVKTAIAETLVRYGIRKS